MIVGRSRESNVAVTEDRELSRRHFAVRVDGTRCLVRDLHSANGTWIDGVRLNEPRELQPGGRITAGDSEFLLDHAEEDGGVGLTQVQASATTPDQDAVFMAIDNRTPFMVATLFWEDANASAKMTVIVKATFSMEPNRVALAPKQLPLLSGDVHYGGDPLRPVRLESDMVPFKPSADVVLVGHAYAPRGEPVARVDTALRVGSKVIRITVHGDRFWLPPASPFGRPTTTYAQPFARMELSYERAFGGFDPGASTYEERNLCGTGHIGQFVPASIDGKRLPNLEDPGDPIRAWDSRPQPVGYGFYGRGWAPRLRLAGTYDDVYRKERAPAAPRDFSYRFFNGAHPDLQCADYLRGDEAIGLSNLAPQSEWRFSLPGMYPKVTVLRRCMRQAASLETAHALFPREAELPMNLDTLVLMPDERQLYLVFRGICELSELDAAELSRIRVSV